MAAGIHNPSLETAPPETRSAALLDESQPYSMINLVSPVIRATILDHAFTNPECFGREERDLARYLHSLAKRPSPVDNRIRLKWWMEYERAQLDGKKMNVSNITAGICGWDYFYTTTLKNPWKVGWLLCPPSNYMVKAEEALEYGLEQLRDLLDKDHEISGKIDYKLANLKLKIVAMLDERVKGAVVQRNLNINATATQKQVEEMTTLSVEDLQKQLKQLDERNERAKNLPLPDQGAIDVESE